MRIEALDPLSPVSVLLLNVILRILHSLPSNYNPAYSSLPVSGPVSPRRSFSVCHTVFAYAFREVLRPVFLGVWPPSATGNGHVSALDTLCLAFAILVVRSGGFFFLRQET